MKDATFTKEHARAALAALEAAGFNPRGGDPLVYSEVLLALMLQIQKASTLEVSIHLALTHLDQPGPYGRTAARDALTHGLENVK